MLQLLLRVYLVLFHLPRARLVLGLALGLEQRLQGRCPPAGRPQRVALGEVQPCCRLRLPEAPAGQGQHCLQPRQRCHPQQQHQSCSQQPQQQPGHMRPSPHLSPLLHLQQELLCHGLHLPRRLLWGLLQVRQPPVEAVVVLLLLLSLPVLCLCPVLQLLQSPWLQTAQQLLRPGH